MVIFNRQVQHISRKWNWKKRLCKSSYTSRCSFEAICAVSSHKDQHILLWRILSLIIWKSNRDMLHSKIIGMLLIHFHPLYTVPQWKHQLQIPIFLFFFFFFSSNKWCWILTWLFQATPQTEDHSCWVVGAADWRYWQESMYITDSYGLGVYPSISVSNK